MKNLKQDFNHLYVWMLFLKVKQYSLYPYCYPFEVQNNTSWVFLIFIVVVFNGQQYPYYISSVIFSNKHFSDF